MTDWELGAHFSCWHFTEMGDKHVQVNVLEKQQLPGTLECCSLQPSVNSLVSKTHASTIPLTVPQGL